MAARQWTDEQKQRQAELIRSWKPWEKSTGAKTDKGKAKSSMNAHRGYFRTGYRLACWLARERYRTDHITLELINEFICRADKLKLFDADVYAETGDMILALGDIDLDL